MQTLPKNENSVNLIFLVNKKVKVCDVLSKGSMDVVCSAGQKRHTLYRSARIQTYTHMCSGVFFSSSFFFGLCFCTQACCFLPKPSNTLDWGGVCVGGWRGCFNAFISGWHRIPPQYYIICTCTQCVFVCVHRDNHTCLLNVNSCCWQYLKMAKHEEAPPPFTTEYESTKLKTVKGNSVAKTILYFCILCLK